MSRGRAALAGMLGIVGGMVLGLLLAMLVVVLWFDVLHLPPLNDDPKPGIAMLGGLVPVLTAVGGIAGCYVMLRRVRRGQSLKIWSALFGGAILFVLVSLGLIVR